MICHIYGTHINNARNLAFSLPGYTTNTCWDYMLYAMLLYELSCDVLCAHSLSDSCVMLVAHRGRGTRTWTRRRVFIAMCHRGHHNFQCRAPHTWIRISLYLCRHSHRVCSHSFRAKRSGSTLTLTFVLSISISLGRWIVG